MIGAPNNSKLNNSDHEYKAHGIYIINISPKLLIKDLIAGLRKFGKINSAAIYGGDNFKYYYGYVDFADKGSAKKCMDKLMSSDEEMKLFNGGEKSIRTFLKYKWKPTETNPDLNGIVTRDYNTMSNGYNANNNSNANTTSTTTTTTSTLSVPSSTPNVLAPPFIPSSYSGNHGGLSNRRSGNLNLENPNLVTSGSKGLNDYGRSQNTLGTMYYAMPTQGNGNGNTNSAMGGIMTMGMGMTMPMGMTMGMNMGMNNSVGMTNGVNPKMNYGNGNNMNNNGNGNNNGMNNSNGNNNNNNTNTNNSNMNNPMNINNNKYNPNWQNGNPRGNSGRGRGRGGLSHRASNRSIHSNRSYQNLSLSSNTGYQIPMESSNNSTNNYTTTPSSNNTSLASANGMNTSAKEFVMPNKKENNQGLSMENTYSNDLKDSKESDLTIHSEEDTIVEKQSQDDSIKEDTNNDVTETASDVNENESGDLQETTPSVEDIISSLEQDHETKWGDDMKDSSALPPLSNLPFLSSINDTTTTTTNNNNNTTSNKINNKNNNGGNYNSSKDNHYSNYNNNYNPKRTSYTPSSYSNNSSDEELEPLPEFVSKPITRTKLNISRIPPGMTYDQLYSLFLEHGHILDMTIKPAKIGTVAFLEYSNPDEAMEAIRELDDAYAVDEATPIDQIPQNLDSLCVDYAYSDGITRNSREGVTPIFIKGLPSNMKRGDLKIICVEFGDIAKTRLSKIESNHGIKCSATIEYVRKDSTRLALAYLGDLFHKYGYYTVKVEKYNVNRNSYKPHPAC